MAMRALSSADPPTRNQTWKMLNEAWGYVSGGLTVADFAANARLQEGHIAFVESGHDHDGVGSRAITSVSIRKKNFDLQTITAAWGTYFLDRISEDTSNEFTYMYLGGSGSVTVAPVGGSMPGVSWGFDPIHWDPEAAPTGNGELHLRNLTAYDTNWGAATLVGAFASPIMTLNERYLFHIEVDFENDRFYFWAVTKDLGVGDKTMYYDYIVALRFDG